MQNVWNAWTINLKINDWKIRNITINEFYTILINNFKEINFINDI